jgi:hypothetical protein
MLRVRTETLSAGPAGVIPAGTVLDLEESAAIEMVEAGYATFANPPPPPPPEIEDSSLLQPKTAVLRRIKKQTPPPAPPEGESLPGEDA